MFLGVGKHDHDDHGHDDKSTYELLDHGCHSNSLAHQIAGNCAARDDEHHCRGPSMLRKTGKTGAGKARFLSDTRFLSPIAKDRFDDEKAELSRVDFGDRARDRGLALP